jgi:hypothetical protein
MNPTTTTTLDLTCSCGKAAKNKGGLSSHRRACPTYLHNTTTTPTTTTTEDTMTTTTTTTTPAALEGELTFTPAPDLSNITPEVAEVENIQRMTFTIKMDLNMGPAQDLLNSKGWSPTRAAAAAYLSQLLHSDPALLAMTKTISAS